MLDQTSNTAADSEDAFTLFALEPATNQQSHPPAPPPSGLNVSQPAGTDVYKDANGAVRLKLSA